MSAPCAEVLVRRAQLTPFPSGCPWCGREGIGTFRSGHQRPHADLDPSGPLGGWGRRCPGSRRVPARWRPTLVVLSPVGNVL